MKKIFTILAIATSIAANATNDTITVNKFKLVGPYTQSAAISIDSVDATGKKYNADEQLKASIDTRLWKKGRDVENPVLKAEKKNCVYLLGFTLDNTRFAKVKIESNGGHLIYIDNKQGAEQNLMPGRHEVVLKAFSTPDKSDTLCVKLISKQNDCISLNAEGKRLYTLADYMNGEKASTSSLSAGGRYLLLNTYVTVNGGNKTWKKEIIDLKTGISQVNTDFKQWASSGDRYISVRYGVEGEAIYEYVDPANGRREPLFTDYAKLGGTFLNGEKEILINKSVEGPKDDKDIHQILQPDDRMPGWRNRNNVQLLDVKSGQLTQLTQGHHSSYAEISLDGKLALIQMSEEDMTLRPFTFQSLYLYNRETEQLDTLVRKDGFLSSARLMPDGKSIILMASPEAFGGIGKNDPTGKIPSMIQQELYQMNLQTREIKSLTFDFNPNISSFQISRVDGCIYALCENRDRHDIFRINPKNGKIDQLKLSLNYVRNFSLADNKALLCYSGQSESVADQLYTVDLKTGKETLIRDWNKQRMGDIQLGECHDWWFTSSRGDSICGRYYLPPHFDATKKYPMLVYYYGGCSPTGRYLESYYNFHGWAAMGYVVYVVQPSGCTGFGQEFAARHVNTYGEGTADDIIEGTKQFCREHPFVNEKKIGCLGASYGGFMTQYLMTVTDIFAASMSHAGISNPTSYWGYGYWGYSYSAISAANSYPWNNQKLLSGQAPLFNADKVHTPILFLHGGADTNVPINESIQMFNALKILGRETAFVVVEGQDHHILDYEKQKKWVSTYYAWFAKWLQDDPTWWDTLYPEKHL